MLMEMEQKSVQVLKNPTFSIALLQHCRMQNGQKKGSNSMQHVLS